MFLPSIVTGPTYLSCVEIMLSGPTVCLLMQKDFMAEKPSHLTDLPFVWHKMILTPAQWDVLTYCYELGVEVYLKARNHDLLPAAID